MANLTGIEKMWVERFLGMGSGYVLNFSDRTFGEFILEHCGIDIFDKKYSFRSGSKANRLRAFWASESNYVVGKLLTALTDYKVAQKHFGNLSVGEDEEREFKECEKISERLMKDVLVENIDSLQPNAENWNFEVLAKSVRDAIQKNEPQSALDRMHTFMVRYCRQLCDNHNIVYSKDESLNSVFGKYVKLLVETKLVETLMAQRILKSSISILEAFNDVRNNKSFAHGNDVLNYDESLLIVNSITNLKKYIDSIEARVSRLQDASTANVDDLPF